MKHRYFLYMLISIILVVGACSQTDDENSTENDTEENDINDSEAESEESEDQEYNDNDTSDETEDYRSDIGNLNIRSEEHTSELQSRGHLVCRLLLEKKKNKKKKTKEKI